MNPGKVVLSQGKVLSEQLALAKIHTVLIIWLVCQSHYLFVCFFRYRSTLVRMVVGGFLPFRFVVDVLYGQNG